MRFLNFFTLLFLFPMLLTAQDTDTVKNFREGKEILMKYIEAIGGVDNYLAIKDKKIVMEGKVQGMDLSSEIFFKAPNRLMQRTTVAGMEQIILFDGTQGYQKGMNGEEEITGDALEMLKLESSSEALVNPDEFGIKYTTKDTVTLDGGTAYKVEKTYPSGNSNIEYYDIATGLKVKEERAVETPQGVLNQVVYLQNYTEVKGVKLPFKLIQEIAGMKIELTVKTAEINVGLKDAIFMK